MRGGVGGRVAPGRGRGGGGGGAEKRKGERREAGVVTEKEKVVWCWMVWGKIEEKRFLRYYILTTE